MTEFPATWWRYSSQFRSRESVSVNEDAQVLYYVRSGWMGRARVLTNGRRQILELLLPGDHYVSHRATASLDVLTALSSCEVARVPFAVVQQALQDSDALRAEMAAAERRRSAILEEHVVSLGQRTATQRTAHLFCEIVARIGNRIPADGCEYPITQIDLGDLLGLSVVHTNRILQELRRKGLVTIQRGQLTVVNRGGLTTLADFSPEYLR